MLAEVERPHKSLDPDSSLERKPLYHIKIDRGCFLHWFRASANALARYFIIILKEEARAGVERKIEQIKGKQSEWLQEDRQQAAETHLDISG